MISASKEKLQQQLEYTQLKPATLIGLRAFDLVSSHVWWEATTNNTQLKADCQSWWISKIQSDTLEERYAIKLCFKLGNNATETYGMLQTAFGASCINRESVFVWHKRFKEGRESVRDDEMCGRSM